MKKALFLFAAFALFICLSATTDSTERIVKLEVEVASQKTKLDDLEKRLNALEEKTQSGIEKTTTTTQPKTSGRCQARTKKGTQCSRSAQAGSSYCWQHQ